MNKAHDGIQNIENQNSGDQPIARRPIKPGFSQKAWELVQTRENMGCLENPDGEADYRGDCGDGMQIHLRVVDDVIREARFTTDGCGASIACGSMTTKLVCSKSLDDAWLIEPEDVLTALESIPKGHEHCAELAVSTLREALTDAEKKKR